MVIKTTASIAVSAFLVTIALTVHAEDEAKEVNVAAIRILALEAVGQRRISLEIQDSGELRPLITTFRYGNSIDERAWVRSLEQPYLDQIDVIGRAIPITPAQREKYKVAAQNKGHHDRREIVRLQRELDELTNANLGMHSQAYAIAKEFSERFKNRVMADDSLFKKVVETNLTDEQKQAYERSRVESMITRIEYVLMLSPEQREKLIEIAHAQKVELPLWSDKLAITKLSQVDQAALAHFLNDEQVRAFEVYRTKQWLPALAQLERK